MVVSKNLTLTEIHIKLKLSSTFFKYTWCDNLIPGMALWKQNLLTCALAAAVAFEILSLWNYALREMMVPLPETVLKIIFRNTSQ